MWYKLRKADRQTLGNLGYLFLVFLDVLDQYEEVRIYASQHKLRSYLKPRSKPSKN